MRQDLSSAIDDYVRFRRSQDFSKGTLAQDRSALKRFLAVVGNIGVHQITDRSVSMYFEAASRTRQSQSLRVDYNVLSKFFDWARHTRRMAIDNDPLFGRRRPRDVKRERNRIPVSQFPQLLDIAGEKEPRDRALMSIFLYTLLRDQEAADLRIGDVDLASGWLRCRIHKSGTEDRMPISTELDAELRTWLTTYTASVGEVKPNYYLLPARKTMPLQGAGGRITGHTAAYRPERPIRAMGRMVNPILERMGFPIVDQNGKPCGEGAHTIRRSGARALFDVLSANGYDNALRLIQSLLHHKSITTTEGYLGITADRRTRDEVLRGQIMYPVSAENVVALGTVAQ